MPLYEMTASAMVPVPVTTFSREEVLERAGLQRVLRDHVNVVAPGVLVVAEEFAAFEDARRRIDLLGVDQEGNVVVVELKRTSDGGHLELQALRYAAMVSAMTFDDLATALARYRAAVAPELAGPRVTTSPSTWQALAARTPSRPAGYGSSWCRRLRRRGHDDRPVADGVPRPRHPLRPTHIAPARRQAPGAGRPGDPAARGRRP